MRWRSAARAGAALAAYGLAEPYLFRLQSHELEVRAGAPALDVLHLSDTHLNVADRALKHFLGSLPSRLERPPDLVLATGDLIEQDEAIEELLGVLAPLEATAGKFFVLGSHDYFIGERPSYRKYFSPERHVRPARRADTARLVEGLRAQGWIDVLNTSHVVRVGSSAIRVAGVDDPYLARHRTDHIAPTTEDLAVALVHAPDVVSEWILAGFDLVVAGHTHAGQVRLPGMGAVVTNCSLPSGLAGGPNRIGASWLHVSPGLGTGRFTPIRFGARPEATLLRVRARRR